MKDNTRANYYVRSRRLTNGMSQRNSFSFLGLLADLAARDLEQHLELQWPPPPKEHLCFFHLVALTFFLKHLPSRRRLS